MHFVILLSTKNEKASSESPHAVSTRPTNDTPAKITHNSERSAD